MVSNAAESYPFDVFKRHCASHMVLDLLSGKWTYLTVTALRQGRMRNAALARKIEGISPKMLSQTLRGLEHDGLVLRTVHAEVPPRVEYELTPLGEELAGLMDQICIWAQNHVPDILISRAANGDAEAQARLAAARVS